jgi:tetratricopeptide (TPR) repeat protein
MSRITTSRAARATLALGVVLLGTGLGEISLLARTWTSKDGSHRIEAEFVECKDGLVVLRKPDGMIVRVHLSKLNDEARAFIKQQQVEPGPAQPAVHPKPAPGTRSELAQPAVHPKPAPGTRSELAPAGPDSELAPPEPDSEPAEAEPVSEDGTRRIRNFVELAEAANRCASAKEAIVLYQRFLADESMAASDLQAAKNNLPLWQSRVEKNLVRLGTRWLDPNEAAAHRARARELVLKGRQLLEVDQGPAARDKLMEANREDPDGIEGHFLLGIGYALLARDATTARQHFSECVKRQPSHVASLNNLALADVRLNHYDDALRCWRKAIEVSPATPEIIQNLGRFLHLGDRLHGARGAQKKAADLQTELVGSSQTGFDARTGWFYMPCSREIGLPRLPNTGSRPGKPGEDRACMLCNGLGTVKCPNRQCKNGSVPGGKVVTMAGRLPDGTTAGFEKPVRVRCPVCGGKGRVCCPDCVGGIDKELSSYGPVAPRRAVSVGPKF